MKVRPKSEQPDDPEHVPVEGRKDRLLALLVTLIDEFPEAALSITVTLPGGSISGRIVSRITYLRQLGDSLQIAFGGPGQPGADAIKEIFAEASETTLADTKESHTQEMEVDFQRPEYIHLSNARFVHGRDLVPDSGALMRIRLRDVSGFILGELALNRSAHS